MQPIEIGRKFLDDVLSLIPEDKQEEARSRYSRAQNEYQEAVSPLESRQTELENYRARLEQWSKGRQAEIDRREQELKAREAKLGAPSNGNPNPNDPPVREPHQGNGDLFTKDQVNELVRQEVAKLGDVMGSAFVSASDEQIQLMQRHAQLYQGAQPFNLRELYAHPRVREIGLTGAYEDLHKDRIAAARKADEEAREKQIREDERQKTLAELGTNKTLPFPTPGEDDSPFGAMARGEQAGKDQFGVDAAVAYARQVRAQQAQAAGR